MRYNLTRTVDPATEPISLADAKEHMHIDVTADDTYIDSLITVVRDWVETFLNISLITQTWAMRMDDFPRGSDNGYLHTAIEVPRSPVSSVTSIVYKDGNGDDQTWSAASYQTDLTSFPARILPISGGVYPTTQSGTMNSVTTTYVAGFGAASDVPERYIQGMKLLIHHMYDEREATSPDALKEIPYGVKALLDIGDWRFV